MATQRSQFSGSHLRLPRRRFSRRTRLPLALLLILSLPTLILIPGYTLASPKVVIRDRPAPAHPAVATLPPANITAVVLFHGEYATLNHTLSTWRPLLPHIAHFLFFLNGVASHAEFVRRLPVLRTPAFASQTIIPSPENLPLGLAITRAVRHARHDHVLLLEKDWALVEREPGHQLATAGRLLSRGVHVVRLRHRHFPGAPLHARIMHDGREDSIFAEQPNLLCYVHHWLPDPVRHYPRHFSVCPGLNLRDAVWCAPARYCQWTNNPALFKKAWFLSELGERFERDYGATRASNPRSSMLDFEFYTNWKSDVWNDRDFVVALPRGLFEHHEIAEGGLMNTVWYAWNRLQKDVAEKRRAYLQQAAAACGRDVPPDEGLWSFSERYPVGFVRQYSYDRAMKRTVEEGVRELRAEAVRVRERLEGGHGTWRHGVTDMTNLWYRISLYVYPSEPRDMRIGFVTALFHTEEADDGGRGFRDEVDTAGANLHVLRGYSHTVYCMQATQTALEAVLREKHGWTKDTLDGITFVAGELDALLERVVTKENVDRIRLLHQGEEYRARVGQRTGAIPSERALLLAHAKPYLLDDAMRGGVTHGVWYDASSACVKACSRRGRGMSDRNDAVLRSELFLHAFVTGIPVSTEKDLEVALTGSGFDEDVFLKHMEKTPGAQLGFVDMLTMGGSRMAVTLMTGYYDVVLRDLLRSGALGTGREAMSIARNNVDYHFRFFDGLSGCSRNLEGAHSCEGVGGTLQAVYMQGGQGCALWKWIGECDAG